MLNVNRNAIRQRTKFLGISIAWLMLSVSLIGFAVSHMGQAGWAGHFNGQWLGFLVQIAVLWLGLVSAGIGLAHISLKKTWYESLQTIVSLWREFLAQQWSLLGFILSLSYISLAIMSYVMQKNNGIEGQILLAITAATLVMFSRNISQQALYAAIKVSPDSKI